MAIARNPVVMLDCPDPQILAEFYGALLGWTVGAGEEWWSIRSETGASMSFQRVADYRPPQWPGQESPQQMHLDIDVDDLDVAETAVLELGATKHEQQPGASFRVFLDPAGHPFCLCED